MTGQLSDELYFSLVFCWFFLARDYLMTIQCVAQLSTS